MGSFKRQFRDDKIHEIYDNLYYEKSRERFARTAEEFDISVCSMNVLKKMQDIGAIIT